MHYGKFSSLAMVSSSLAIAFDGDKVDDTAVEIGSRFCQSMWKIYWVEFPQADMVAITCLGFDY